MRSCRRCRCPHRVISRAAVVVTVDKAIAIIIDTVATFGVIVFATLADPGTIKVATVDVAVAVVVDAVSARRFVVFDASADAFAIAIGAVDVGVVVVVLAVSTKFYSGLGVSVAAGQALDR